MRIRHSLAGRVLAVLIVLVFFPAQPAFAWTANWVSNPTSCAASDVQFPGQLCPGVLKICGVNGSSIPQCYDMSTLAAPGSTTTSNTLQSGSLGGGYVIDCNSTLDSAAPYCNNNGAAWCNRSDTCYTTKKRIT